MIAVVEPIVLGGTEASGGESEDGRNCVSQLRIAMRFALSADRGDRRMIGEGRVRSATAGSHAVLDIPTWRVLLGEVRRRPIDIVIADPAARCADTGDGVAALQAIHEFAPVLVYTTVTTETSRAILSLAAYGVHDFVFAGFDDVADRLRLRLEEVVARAGDQSVMPQILAAIGEVGPPASQRPSGSCFARPGDLGPRRTWPRPRVSRVSIRMSGCTAPDSRPAAR